MRRGFIRVFRCPKCGRVIRTTAERCKYCSVAIDPVAAEATANLDEQVHEANFEAEMITTLVSPENARHQPSWWFVIAAPFFFLRWWIRTRRFPQDHPELVASKRSIKHALSLWVPLLIVLIIYLASRFGWL